MNKFSKHKAEPAHECTTLYAPNKSPLRRNNMASPHHHPKSPIRLRTPTKNVSPIKPHHLLPNNFRFIPNVSPIRQRRADAQNNSQFSNGKNLKYIHNFATDKPYQTSKKERNLEINKKSDRKMAEDNRLFSKLVGKLHFEKYTQTNSNESSYKTNVAGDNSDSKNRIKLLGQNSDSKSRLRLADEQPSNRVKLTAPRPDKIFKNIINQVKAAEPHTQNGPVSLKKSRQKSILGELQAYNLIYKNSSRPKLESCREPQLPRQPQVLTKARKKTSKCSQKLPPQASNQNEDYTDFEILLEKIEQGYENARHATVEESVKMSGRVQNSLSMDPFL